MDDLPPTHYWKIPFYWEPGNPMPPPRGRLQFEPVAEDWLRTAIGRVMEAGTDASDLYNVPRVGLQAAVQEVYELLPQYFVRPEGAWKAARNEAGARVGFVLPVLFKDARMDRDGHPQGTIYYMGVLPEHRGCGHALELVHEATRVLVAAGCWRVFCDTGQDNLAMVRAFRRAGYTERARWQRPLA